MSDTKEYIKGDKHVHQAGSVMIKFAQYVMPGRQTDEWRRQAQKEAEELEKEFADFEEVADQTEPQAPRPQSQAVADAARVDVFVNRVKAVVMKAAEKNGESIATNARSWEGSYQFFVDGVRISKMMADLRKTQEKRLEELLSQYQSCDGVTVVAPFIGKILEIEELRAKGLQNRDLDFAFTAVYGKKTTAVKKMSDKLRGDDTEVLFGIFKGLLRKYPRA